MKRKKLGIIGGMGSRAGAYFLKKIIDYSPAETDQEFPEIIFHNNSGIPDRTRAIVYKEASPLKSILQSVQLFNQNGVELIAMGCITAYYYYPQIATHTHARILNPLDMVATHIKMEYPAARRIGILATTGTIQTGLFHLALEAAGMEVVTLDAESQEALFMEAVYMKNGYKSAAIAPEAGHLMEQAIRKLMEYDVDLVIGGCTEVSIAVTQDMMEVPFLDMLDLLARKTVEYCYGFQNVNI